MLLGLRIDYESRRVEDTYSTTECSRCLGPTFRRDVRGILVFIRNDKSLSWPRDRRLCDFCIKHCLIGVNQRWRANAPFDPVQFYRNVPDQLDPAKPCMRLVVECALGVDRFPLN